MIRFILSFQPIICYILVICLVFQPLAFAQVTIDPSEKNIYLDESVNGVPIVGINAPQNGLSQNKFTDYNVGAEGVIINNSTTYGMSALGGYLLGNTNFSDEAASSILFDVTGKNVSRLLGTQEIFGQKANFMLSNPNGLYINGYGFINTNSVRLTTGRPTYVGSELRYDVRSGTIVLAGAGLNASNVAWVDVLAHAIDIQGKLIAAGDARLVAGAFQVNPNSGALTTSVQSSNRIAIDVSGDLQANSIQLIATDEGAGVNSTGRLISSSDDIVINSNGDILLANANSASDVQLFGSDVTLTGGDISVEESLQVSASDQLLLDDVSITALNEISFDADDFDAMTSDIQSTELTLNATDALISDSSVVAKDIAIQSTQTEVDSDASIQVVNNLQVTGDLSNAGTLVALNELTTDGDAFTNDGVVYANDASIKATSVNQQQQLLLEGDLRIDAQQVVNDGRVVTGGSAQLAAENVSNDGVLSVGAELQITATELTNDGDITVAGDASLQGNDDGMLQIKSSGRVTVDASLTVANASLENDGQLLVGETFLADVGVMNNAGQVMIYGDANIVANDHQNSGQLMTGGDVSVTANALLNSGTTQAMGAVNLVAERVTNTGALVGDGIAVSAQQVMHSGVMVSGDDLTVKQQADFLVDGALIAAGDLTIQTAGTITNNAMVSGAQVQASADVVSNQGLLLATDQVAITANVVQNQNFVSANTGITVYADSIQNEGTLLSLDDLALSAVDVVTNNGLILAADAMNIDTQTLVNVDTKGDELADFSQGIQAWGALTIDTTTLNNRDGLILGHEMTVNATEFDNTAGQVVDFGQASSFVVENFNNDAGRLESNGQIQLDGQLSNTNGVVYAGNGLALNDVDNTNGQLLANTGVIDIAMDSAFVNDDGAVISYGGDIAIQAADYSNKSGVILAKDDLSLSIDADFHDEGLLAAMEGDMRLTAASFVLTKALSAGGDLVIDSAGQFQLGNDVWLYGGSGVQVDATSSVKNNGVIESEGDIQLSAGTTLTNTGYLTAMGDVAVTANAGALQNTGEMHAGDDMHLLATTDITNTGTIRSNGDLTMDGKNMTNRSLVYANQDLTINMANSVVNYGDILAAGDMVFHHDGEQMTKIENHAALIESGGSLILRAKTINNNAKYDLVTRYYKVSSSLTELGSRNEDQNYEFWNGHDTYWTRTSTMPSFPTTKTKTYMDQNITNYHAATIQSGHDMVVSGDHFYNKVSHVSAGGDLHAGNTHFHNNHLKVKQVDRTFYTKVTYIGLEEACSGWEQLKGNCSGKDAYHYQNSVAYYDKSSVTNAKSAAISIGGVFNLHGDYSAHQVDLSHGHSSATVDESFTPTLDTTNANLTSLVSSLEQDAINQPLKSGAVAIDSAEFADGLVSLVGSDTSLALRVNAPELTAGINGPGNLSFERQRVAMTNVADVNPDYFIQAVGFRSEADLLASDYFYDRIKEKYPDAFRLGSEYTEQKYIERMLDQELGRRMLYAEVQTMPEQMNVWYANAESLVSDLGVPVGEPLSADVVANLDKDVLWMELVEMDGKLVMAPRLYLSADTKARLAAEGTGPMLIADVVALEDSSLDLSAGLLQANTLVGSAGSINNASLAQIKTGDMAVTAKGDITNQGKIKSTGLLSLATSGNVQQSGQLSAGQLLSLKAGKNLTDTAGTYTADGNVVLTAGGDMAFNAIEDPNGLNHQVTKISAGKNVVIDSGGNVDFQATELNAAASAKITSGGDLTMRTVTDRSYDESVDENNGTKTTVKSVTDAERGVAFNVGENFITDSGGDTTLTAASIDAGGAVQMVADGDLNVLEGKSTTTTTTTTESTDWVHSSSPFASSGFGSSGLGSSYGYFKTTKGSSTETKDGVVKSSIRAGGTMDLRSDQSLTISASDLSAGGDIGLKAKGRVILASKKERAETTSDVRKGPQVYGLGETGTETTVSETLAQTTIKSGGVMRIDGDSGVDMISVDLDMAEGGYIQSTNGSITNTALALENSTMFDGRVNGRKTSRINQTKTGQASTIDAGALGFEMKAKNDIALAGTKINSAGNVALTAEEGEIKLTGLKNSSYSKEQQNWTSSSHFGFVKKKHEKVSEDYNETVDRSTITAANYSAKAKGDIIKQGTTIKAGTIYEEGADLKELTMGLASLDRDDTKTSSSITFGGLLTIDDVKTNESEVLKRAKINEVNENQADGAIVKNFSGTVLLQGSEITSIGGPVAIKGKDVMFDAVNDFEEVTTMTREKKLDAMSFKADLKKFQAGMETTYSGTTKSTYNYDETARGVAIQGQGVQVIATDGKIAGAGTKINSGAGALNLTATKGLDFTEAREVHIDEESTSNDTYQVRQYVGNKWGETAVTVYEAADAGDTVDAAATAGRLTKNIADSASSAATLGFYAGVEYNESHDKTTQRTTIDRGVGAQFVSGGGMSFDGGSGNIDFTGAQVINGAGDIRFKVDKAAGGQINLLAGKTTVESTFSQSSNNKRVYGETNIIGHAEAGVSRAENNSKSSQTGSYVQNTMIANAGGTIHYEGDTLNLDGAESFAKVQDLSGVDHLRVVSQQDTTITKDSSNGSNMSVGFSTGGGVSVGGGVSSSSGEGSSKWTNSVSKLVGSEDVKGNLDSLELTGGQVYVQTDVFDTADDSNTMFNDQNSATMGQMSLTAKAVQLTDLADSDTYSQRSYNVNGSIGGFGDGKAGESAGMGFGIKGKDKDKRDVVKSVIGLGALQDDIAAGTTAVEGEGAAVTSFEKARVTVKDKDDSWGINVEDTRMITDTAGYVQDEWNALTGTVNDIAGLASAGQAVENVGQAGSNLIETIGENMSGKGSDGVIADYQGKTRNQELALQLKVDNDLNHALAGMTKDDASMRVAEGELEDLANKAMLANGIGDADVDVEFYNAEDGNMGGHKDGKIYINMAYQDGSKEKLMEVMGDELSHYTDYKQGKLRSERQSNNSQTDVSRQYGDNAAKQTVRYVGDETFANADGFKDQLSNLDFSEVNQEVANTEGMEQRVYTAARDLNGFPIGTHQFQILIPDNPEDFTKEKIKDLGIPEMRDLGNGEKGWVIGGHNKLGQKAGERQLKAEFFQDADFQASKEFLNPKENRKWYKRDFSPEASLVKHEGKTDTEYITDILKNTKHYQDNESDMPIPYPKNIDQYDKGNWNSNSWNNSSLKHAGGTEYQTDFKGMDPARNNVIPQEYFEPKKLEKKEF